jgi:hypothetical protein
LDWITLIAFLAILGIYHGINPSMGWPFSLLLAFRYGRLSVIFAASLAISLGHAVSVAVLMIPFILLNIATGIGLKLAGILLIFLGIYRILRPQQHRYAGLSIGLASMILWGFFTGLAHGSGLVLVPVAEELRISGISGHSEMHATSATISISLSIVIHTVFFFATLVIITLLAYKLLGTILVKIVWKLNYDLLWSLSIIGIGIIILLFSILFFT